MLFNNKILTKTKSTFFKQNFIFLFIVLILLFSLAITCFHFYSIKSNNRQLILSTENELSTIVRSIDEQVALAKYYAVLLSNNSLVTAVLNSDPENELLFNQTARMKEYLDNIISANKFIDSIYLYSDAKRHIFTKYGYISIDYFEDDAWLNISDISEPYGYSRAINNIYPYVYTILTPMKISGERALIVMNLNFNNFSAISNANYKNIYILHNDKVIFSPSQNTAQMHIDDFPQLAAFLQENTSSQLTSSSHETQIFTSLNSSQMNWNIIMQTTVATYSQMIGVLLLYSILLLIISLFASFVIALYFTTRTYKPIITFLKYFDDSTFELDNNEIEFISTQIVQLLSQNQELLYKVQQQSQILKETELLALHSLFNPHFLFNTLTLINTLEIEALGVEHPAPQLTVALCKILRYSLNATPLVTLDTDIKYTNQYINILKQRYPGTLQIEIEIDEDLYDCIIPSLLIQPIIENAIVHGYKVKQYKNFYIHVNITSSNEHIKILVSDNGIGIDTKTIEFFNNLRKSEFLLNSKKKTGFAYTILKLKALYAENFDFNISINAEGGTTVALTIPKNKPDLPNIT